MVLFSPNTAGFLQIEQRTFPVYSVMTFFSLSACFSSFVVMLLHKIASRLIESDFQRVCDSLYGLLICIRHNRSCEVSAILTQQS